MARLPDAQSTLAIVERVASAPTAPYHERQALRAIEDELRTLGIETERDAYGQLHARAHRGTAAHPFALIAHTDHPAFDVVSARGREGRARVLGGWTGARDEPNNSVGICRIRAERELRVGQFAVVDLPGYEVHGDELRLRAADDLALCAVIVLALAALKDDPRPHDVHAVFTRAEETGLYGARLV